MCRYESNKSLNQLKETNCENSMKNALSMKTWKINSSMFCKSVFKIIRKCYLNKICIELDVKQALFLQKTAPWWRFFGVKLRLQELFSKQYSIKCITDMFTKFYVVDKLDWISTWKGCGSAHIRKFHKLNNAPHWWALFNIHVVVLQNKMLNSRHKERSLIK